EQPNASNAVFDTPSENTIDVPVREYRSQYVAMLESAQEAGFYVARVSVQAPGMPIAVNVDTRESDVACLPETELRTMLDDTAIAIATTEAELLSAIEAERTGKSSWRFFMLLGLTFLIAESLFADRLLSKQLSRSQSTESTEVKQDV
ncbi:MAG: hypothetical protein VB814_04520, partial [Pirellulaceae bacterium]